MKKTASFFIGLLLLLYTHAQKVATPDQIYGDLFVAIQMNHIFSDNKTFVDCVPKKDPALIVSDYKKIKDNPAAVRNYAMALTKEVATEKEKRSISESLYKLKKK